VAIYYRHLRNMFVGVVSSPGNMGVVVVVVDSRVRKRCEMQGPMLLRCSSNNNNNLMFRTTDSR
jgi:hypothetical protein